MEGFENGIEEIIVGNGEEMGLLTLKRENSTATFRALEQMAAQVSHARTLKSTSRTCQ